VDSEIFALRRVRLLIRFQHLYRDTGITHLRAVEQVVCTPSHTVLNQKQQTSVERFLVRERDSSGIHLVLVDNSVSIMGLVELPADGFQSPNAIHLRTSRFTNHEGDYTWQ
jgi:hypothetical protein